jgi:hypothetical protein
MKGAFYAVRVEMLLPRRVWKFDRFVRESVKRRLSRCSSGPADNEVSAEAEDSPLLEAVTRERLVKTQQNEKI